jgi:hypothetical protein
MEVIDATVTIGPALNDILMVFLAMIFAAPFLALIAVSVGYELFGQEE